MHLLGQFKVGSGKLVVSDPCYDGDVPGLKHLVDDCVKGAWQAAIIRDNRIVTRLIALHHSYPIDNIDSMRTRWIGTIGVDSGQAGVFDINSWGKDSEVQGDVNTHYGQSKWYSYCCDLTLSSQSAGVLTRGAVSSSGYGDGSYGCYALVDNDGKTVGIVIDFMDDSGEDEDEE